MHFGVNRFFLSIVTLLFFAGCGGAGHELPETNSVSGRVILDGQPLEEGVITFTPVELGPSANGYVRNGKIVDVVTAGAAKGVPEGEYVVTIYDDAGEGASSNRIPEVFGTLDSGLSATVKRDGPNEFEFDLSSSPQP